MIESNRLSTPRLRLRQWTAADREPFAALNADPEVMRHFPAPLTRTQSDAMAVRIEALIAERGWGFWAADSLEDGLPRFMGFVGLHTPAPDLPFSPCVEIGWRLARPFWGRGLATEAARLALRTGFEGLGLEEIVSFTAVGNQRSRAVMRRLGMRECPHEAFDHPALPAGHPLRAHCLYRLARADYWGTG
ncbi:GNAT family N-acetyltransferase [Alicycliphilus denitrificans]|uniref:GCN5-related N-acetyltransferase n=1 Tax=Alicycliphilus denitrificans (strain DSM 14773 / CIP 107495 / K601) TaxID=596154 RepID=F4GBB6_ALIDK|nr:GNAT family N-acetyltransferase [Alicycliphilus denitrificans]AEB84692.1 GCN5-related N-acetyltransferase [Alicycliphilus denitrificans K601]